MSGAPTGAVMGAVTTVLLALFVASASARPHVAEPTTGCTAYGAKWAHAYNAHAVKQGNPVRVRLACCGAPEKAGGHACHIMVTLAGTTSTGCEFVQLDRTGEPTGSGKHESCPPA